MAVFPIAIDELVSENVQRKELFAAFLLAAKLLCFRISELLSLDKHKEGEESQH